MSLATQTEIRDMCQDLAGMLCKKNDAYGDSALEPLHVFSKLTPDEGIKVRIDDKLKRIALGNPDAFGEDPIWDLAGYLILYLIAKRRQKALWDDTRVVVTTNTKAKS